MIITGYGDVPMAVRAMKAGALDFIEKPVCDQVLLEHIHDALEVDQKRRQVRTNSREEFWEHITNAGQVPGPDGG